MPKFQQYYYAIQGLEVLNQEELGRVLKMMVFAAEKPVTLQSSKGYLNYPLFYPAIKNKGHKGFLKTKKSFPEQHFGSTLSPDEIHTIINEKSNLSDLIGLVHDTPIYARAQMKKQSRGRPNKLLNAEIELKLKENKHGLYLDYKLEGKNSQKSDDILKTLPMGGLNHNLSIIEGNFTRVQEYVSQPDEIEQLWESHYPDVVDLSMDTTLHFLDFMSDWYWQAKYDEWFWSVVTGRDVDFYDPGDMVSDAINLGRYLGKLSQPALQDLGKMIASGSSDILENMGDAIGGMVEGATGMVKNLDSDDDEIAVVLLVIGGVVLTALLTTSIVYGGVSLRRELLDYNLIWLDKQGIILPNKSRLPLRLLKDIRDNNEG